MKKIVLYSLVFFAAVSCKESSDSSKDGIAADNGTTVVAEKTSTEPTIASKPATGWNGILKMNDNGYANKIASTSRLTIVDFSAEWCGPCKQLHPILESVAKELDGKVNFGNVDVDESPKIASELAITSIPLLVFYKDGKIVDKTIGLMSEADLKAKINEHL
ncbi:MAG: thioredoxin [Chitinophagaceae bacterium]